MYCSMIHPSHDARMVGFTLSKDCECQTVAIEGQFRFVVTASDRIQRVHYWSCRKSSFIGMSFVGPCATSPSTTRCILG